MKKHLFTLIIAICSTGYFTELHAQFSFDPAQTNYLCNATGSQLNVSAFADANGGTYSFWIDKRNGTSGTRIYGQHLDSIGSPYWTTNGKFIAEATSKEIWNMKTIRWQNGFLVAWVQGGFGVGGDTLYCNYYNLNGASQWTQPTVIANKQANIIYVSYDNLDIFPNDSGATISYDLTQNGGNTLFGFNRIDFTGTLRWPLDNYNYQGNGYYYVAADDHHNGFYVAASTGGLGADIFMGHFDLQGNSTIASPVNISSVVGGRGNSQWKVICDNDSNAYVVWASYTNNNISIAKIKPNGTFPWGNAAKPVCTASGQQEIPDTYISGDSIYIIWDDARPGAISQDIYMQLLDTAGNPKWTTDGILLSHITDYIPYPKVIKTGSNIVATFLVGNAFRAQKIRPDSVTLWQQNGIFVNINNPPFYGDYVLVNTGKETVTAIWRESGDNICGERIKPNGTLAQVLELSGSSVEIYPNPFNNQLNIISSEKIPQEIYIYDTASRIIMQQQFTGYISLNTGQLESGVYFYEIRSKNKIIKNGKIIRQ